jgi:hypothetical protein
MRHIGMVIGLGVIAEMLFVTRQASQYIACIIQKIEIGGSWE